MKYRIHTDTTANHPYAGETFLFNTEKHLISQPKSERYTFQLINNKTNLSEARIIFFLEENAALSPLRAPFGSLEFVQGIPYHYLQELVEEIGKFALKKNLNSIRIVSYPTCYGQENSLMLQYVFTSCGYSMEYNEINFHIHPDERSFLERIELKQQQELKKCHQKGYVSGYGKMEEPQKVYEFICRARKARGYPLTLSLEEFIKLFQQFPDDFTFFYVKDKQDLIAVTFGVRVSSRILYNFFMAADPDYQNDSPTVMLLEELYNYAFQQGFKILDYGMASEKGVPNFGLIRFKERTGGIPSLKPVFVKYLK